VETELSRQPGIGKCAVVPVLDKRIHDTVPAIYIVPESHENNAPETVRQALVKVFLEDGLIRDNSLPSQFILVDDIPCNSNGKLDIYRITRDRLNGRAYNILPVRQNGKLTDIGTELTDRLDSITGGTLPEGMGENSALGIYELFNAAPDRKKPPGLPELLRHCRSLHKPGNIKKLMKKTVYTDEEATRTMFDFFDNQKNPFMFMMNMMGNESVPEETPSVDNSNTDPMQFMQQMFMMQMQLMQTMMMLPMQFMQKMADLMNQNPSEEADVRPKPSPKAGFKMGNLTVPPELLAKLMQMEMSPENLKKLQGVLDFVFESMPNPRKEETGQEVDS
jgi:hypothetical protein